VCRLCVGAELPVGKRGQFALNYFFKIFFYIKNINITTYILREKKKKKKVENIVARERPQLVDLYPNNFYLLINFFCQFLCIFF
jgi:hypothetical protein